MLFRSRTSGFRPEDGGPSPLRAGLWLAIILIGAKAVLLGPPESGLWLWRLAQASAQDVIFAVGSGAAGELIARFLAVRKPRLSRAIRILWLVFFVSCALYVPLSVGAFQYFGRPFTTDLLRLMDNAVAARSSVLERITLPIAMAFFACPLLLLVLVFRVRLPVRASAAVVASCCWVAAGLWHDAGSAANQNAQRLALSPHVELIRSTLRGLSGKAPAQFPVEAQLADMTEFQPFGLRVPARTSSFEVAETLRPKNLILIVLESVGTHYLSLYGSSYQTTPCLEAAAANALVFDNFYANAPFTYCSVRSILFGIYPTIAGVYVPWAGRQLPPTIASILPLRGARAVYIHNGDLDWGSTRWMLEQRGFNETFGGSELGCKRVSSWGVEDHCLFDRMIEWIDRDPAKPFVAIGWTDQTHDPYVLTPDSQKADFFGTKRPAKHAKDLERYLNLVRGADAQIGRLLNALRERGLADDTLVVITGDHGEAFSDPHEHRGHSLHIFEEDVKVPLIVWNPRLFPRGQRIATIGSHVDLNATIADIMGAPPAGEWQGHSLMDREHPGRAYLFTDIDEQIFGIRDGPWKYIYNATSGRSSLFDLRSDPGEEHATEDHERSGRFLRRVAAWAKFEESFVRGIDRPLEIGRAR